MAQQNAQQQTDEIEEPGEQPVKPQPAAVTENEEDGTVTVADERPSRKDRRGGRQADEVRRWREEADTLRRQLEETRQQTQQELQRVHQRISQPQQQQDPFRSRLEGIRNEQESIQAQIRAGQITADDAKRLRERFYQLDDEREELRDQRSLQRARQLVQQETQASAGQGEEAIIRAEFPDVIGNQSALRYAMGEYHRLTAKGEPATLATTRKAMSEALKAFNLRPEAPPAVSPAQQQRFGAINGQAGASSSPAEIRLDKSQKAMALARWPQLEEHDAYRRMAALLRSAQTAQPQEE